jgi:hypothetical protein
VHGVEAPVQADLGALRVVGDRQRERDTAPDEPGRLGPLGVVDEVQRAEDVADAPAAPVADALGRGADRLLDGE